MPRAACAAASCCVSNGPSVCESASTYHLALALRTIQSGPRALLCRYADVGMGALLGLVGWGISSVTEAGRPPISQLVSVTHGVWLGPAALLMQCSRAVFLAGWVTWHASFFAWHQLVIQGVTR